MLPKWLSVGWMKKTQPRHGSGTTPALSEGSIESDKPDTELILRDVYLTPFRRTFIEVRKDGIHLLEAGKHSNEVFISTDEDTPDNKYGLIEEGIRCQIARKISMLLPELQQKNHSELLSYTLNVLRFIAQDQLDRVRRIIADELKDLPNAPMDVIRTLIWDKDLKVKLPLLEFSPLLSDTELLDIMSEAPVSGVVEVIAKRKNISEKVSEAIINSNQVQAIANLLDNPNARIGERSLEKIVDNAPQYVLWHEPLLKRPELTPNTIDRIAGFVSVSLIRILEEDQKLKPEMASSLMEAVRVRLKTTQADRNRAAEIRVHEKHLAGELTQDEVLKHLDFGEYEFVSYALALLTNLSRATVERMIQSQSAKVITSLSWKAGFSMRTAIQLQLRLGQVHHTRVLYARGGTDYPLSESEMLHYIDLFQEYNG